ncbi:MAG: hypothetical protein C0619_01565 [Desulfuromonas sp.]|nr:MAG: hypothetical protein C0619_01565 [Desulfuromonas sp.]
MKMKKRLGSLLWIGLAAMLCGPMTVTAAELSIQSDTLLRVFSRDTSTENDAAVMPTYEYLQIDIENPEGSGLSFHLYGWGRLDLADNDFYSDATAGELLYGYMEYSQEQARFNARLGRQHIFEGVSNDAIDGLRLSSELGRYFSGSLYAGQPVALDSENGRSGDSIYGGRLAHHLLGRYTLGTSYKKSRNDSDDAEEMFGIDLSVSLPSDASLEGFSKYNLESEDWGEHSYQLFLAFDNMSLRPYFQKFKYEDYFGTGANSANPFRFLADTGEELTVIGGDLTIPVGDSWVLVAKAKAYDYQILDDSSQYYAVQATWSSEAHNQIGGEVASMTGDVAQNDYYLVRLFTYWDQFSDEVPVSFISGDLVYVGFDKEIYGEDRSLFVSLGTGKKYLDDALELKLSGDYSSDPYFDEDFRGMLTASYRFGRDL